MGLLQDKIVAVVGGTSGIGEAASKLFAKEGATVAVVGRRQAEGEAIVADILAAGGKASFIQADVADAASVEEMTQEIVKRHGRLDAAFNNFGIDGGMKPVIDQTEADYDRIMDINLKGAFFALKSQLPVMLAQGKGAIVFTSSVLAEVSLPGSNLYSASKAGLIGLARSAAVEVAAKGVRVNVVSPAITRTPMTAGGFKTGADGEQKHVLTDFHPIGRVAEPEEVAEAALFLLADRASFITGHTLTVDGGLTAR
ncbi:SDR family NAD(P)-dependent oxidoreductase [Lacibacterium aquatile]|uniref:SDR family NAD(P)-dependent oxidoreductase n=1 Tax=Lacibacterium aquatile TaxID=1168082 RepID=A0ABW5DVM4_9PROT